MGRFSWLGVGLVLTGAAMLLDRLDVVRFGWEPVLLALVGVFGFLKAIDGFEKKKSRRVFWGTCLFLFGGFKLLSVLDVVELPSHSMFPAMLVIIGLSFLTMYISSQ